jgi:hypothetical protein
MSKIDDTIAVARLFLRAFDDDSISLWTQATRDWNERPIKGKLAIAVDDLREAWYHDGSLHQCERCKRRAETLRRAIGDEP